MTPSPPEVATQAKASTPEAEPRTSGLGLRAFFMPFVVVLAVAGSWREHASRAAIDLPVPDFALVDQTGRRTTLESLRGKPWIGAVLFTRCQGPCPMLATHLRELQDKVTGSETQIVVATADPQNDTPEVLSRYAASLTADPERWHLLTGDPAAVTSFALEGLHLGMARDPDPKMPAAQAVTHDTHLVLVGRDGHVRGFFDSNDDADRERLAKEARALGASGRTSPLPLVNALLNATSALLIVLGYGFVRAGKVGAHKTCMLGAVVVSAAFLTCYLVHHAQHGSTPFVDQGPARIEYLARVLISHVVLAIVVVPLVVASVVHGLRGNFARHVAVARWTFGLWLYVSVTGVAVYLLLYKIFV